MTINFNWEISNDVAVDFEDTLNELCHEIIGLIPPHKKTKRKSCYKGQVIFNNIESQKSFYGYCAHLMNNGHAWKHEYRKN